MIEDSFYKTGCDFIDDVVNIMGDFLDSLNPDQEDILTARLEHLREHYQARFDRLFNG